MKVFLIIILTISLLIGYLLIQVHDMQITNINQASQLQQIEKGE